MEWDLQLFSGKGQGKAWPWGKPEQWAWPLTQGLNGNGTRGRNITSRLCSETDIAYRCSRSTGLYRVWPWGGKDLCDCTYKSYSRSLSIGFRGIERCVYIHTDQTRGRDVVLITTQHPHSTSPLSPSPWPFLPTRVNPSLRILTSSILFQNPTWFSHNLPVSYPPPPLLCLLSVLPCCRTRTSEFNKCSMNQRNSTVITEKSVFAVFCINQKSIFFPVEP